MSRPLTAISVEQVKPASERMEISDSGLPGLRLVIQPSGSKSWVVRYKTPARVSRKITLGSYPLIPLAEARTRAREVLVAVSEGRDPAADKAGRAAKATAVAEDAAKHRFAAVAELFVERYAKPRNRTWKRTEQILLRSEVAEWADRDIREIGRRDVINVLDDIVARGAPVQANRTLAALKKFFRWARQRDLVLANPALEVDMPSAENERDRVLSDVELAAVWRAAGAMGYPFGAAFQLLMLTGLRRGEVFNGARTELQLDGGHPLWVIPKERSKNGLEHRVPLTPAAVDILAGLPQFAGTDLLFTTTGRTPASGFGRAFDRLFRSAQKFMPADTELNPFILHDLRRTFASGCARLGVPIHVTEANLNHTTGKLGGIAGVYQRFDFMPERRAAMMDWAVHMTSIVDPEGVTQEAGRSKAS